MWLKIVGFILLLGLLVSQVVPSVAASTWVIQTVDSLGDTGHKPSLALDSSDRPCIAYYDYNSDLRYARWTGAAWSVQTVDSFSGVDIGGLFSLALDSSDNPCIAYSDHWKNDLKYARWDGAVWVIQTVDSVGKVGLYPSLALDSSNNPCISYQDNTKKDLKYAKWNGSGWDIQTVDSEGSVGHYTSLELDSQDRPCISHYDYTNGDLKYARWTGSSWVNEVVDSEGQVGEMISLALDSKDHPHICYYGFSEIKLKYAKWTGREWVIQIVESAGRESSIAVDSQDNPQISFFANMKSTLRFAKGSGTGWAIETVPANTSLEPASSLAINSLGAACIAYTDSSNGDLKYASLSGQVGTPSKLKVLVKDDSGKLVSGVNVASIAQPSGQIVLSGATSSSGAVTFDSILKGSYTLQASKSGYVSGEAVINVGDGASVEITISLQKVPEKGSLKIVVKDKEGVALSGVSVSSTSQPSGQSGLSGVTGADGSIMFSGVIPGDYVVKASKSGYESDSGQGTVASEITKTVNVALNASGGGIPGFSFEIIACGVFIAFIILRMKK